MQQKRQRQADVCEFKDSLVYVYRVNFRTARATQRNPVSKRGEREKEGVEEEKEGEEEGKEDWARHSHW